MSTNIDAFDFLGDRYVCVLCLLILCKAKSVASLGVDITIYLQYLTLVRLCQHILYHLDAFVPLLFPICHETRDFCIEPLVVLCAVADKVNPLVVIAELVLKETNVRDVLCAWDPKIKV